jgi:DtxR family manganese transport transcriptional regulator
MAEDYVELIDEIIREKGEARAIDLATRLQVSHVTVGKTVRRLCREGWMETAPYKPIILTGKGIELASQGRERHEIVLQFLLALGVSRATAETDAEGIEHHVSQETLNALATFSRRRSEKGTL